MLYISTRNHADSFTAHRALHNARTADGGKFIPMQLPVISEKDLLRMKEMTFGEVVALVLNLFFDKKISGWDIDVQVGRSPYKLAMLNHRLILAQHCRNSGSVDSYFEKAIFEKLGGAIQPGESLPFWPKIAIRIAVLFALYKDLHCREIVSFDIALSADDLHAVIAAWYAVKMGLPVGTIICGCDENSGIWDLIHRGEFATRGQSVVCEGLEGLIFDAFGRKETARYLDNCQQEKAYKITQEQCDILQSRIFAAVTGRQRTKSIMKSVSNAAVLDESAAKAYCALQDYRHATGESVPTMIITENRL